MDKFILLFEEFIMKAIVMTESFLNSDLSQNVDLNSFTDNRERLFLVLDQISRQIEWNSVADEKRDELNRQIEYIKRLDEKLLVKLQEYQEEVRKEIEVTVRQKDNIKGYNLSDVK
jgi:phosphatidylserine/phosphatidylglycerophosphate/cardiolipin synthase-like enzyme